MKQQGRMRTLLASALVTCAAGCLEEEGWGARNLDGSVILNPLDGGSAIEAPAPIPDAGTQVLHEPVSALDVLFVIDNSGSMASEQEKLARELTRIVKVLTSGDRYAEREDRVPPGLTEKARRFTPVSSLHVGVVSTNVGGIDQPTGTQAAVLSCAGRGDDGILQHSTSVAVDGVLAKRLEFQDYAAGDTVIAPSAECQLPPQPTYQSYLTSDDPAAVGLAFRCVARLGVRGCPFEQQLESMWKALAPSSAPAGAPTELYTFTSDGRGQGDLANRGFLRENAVLAVVHLSDEDDCSITDAGKALFSLGTDAQQMFGPLNLRCGTTSDPTLVRSSERYVSGLRSLKPGHPERIVFAAVVGVPTSPIAAGASYDELLALPEMQFREDPLKPGFPERACSVVTDGRDNEAYPGRRFLQVAKSLGAQSVVESICAETYGPVLDRMIDKIAPQLGGT